MVRRQRRLTGLAHDRDVRPDRLQGSRGLGHAQASSKQINDAYGHGAGDTALREVAGRCRTLLRTSDLLGRYGGDELVALLPETHAQGAAQLADRIRDAVTGEPVRAGDALLALTLSLGVADSDGCEDLDGLLHRADVALYQAKRRGRDQAATWSAGGRGSRARG
jgi:diguanylate cyclase (GGDEF)-like protein